MVVTFHDLLDAAERPTEYLLSVDESALALTFSSYFPLELLDWAGFHAAQLLPATEKATPLADGLLQTFVCFCVRSAAETVLRYQDRLALLAHNTSCDARNILMESLALADVTVPQVLLRVPVRTEVRAAVDFFAKEMESFVQRVADIAGTPLDLDRLREAIVYREHTREAVRRVFAGLEADEVDPVVAYAVGHASRLLAPRDFLEAVREYGVSRVGPPGNAVRAMVSGAVLPSLRVIRQLVESGLWPVFDDTCLGTRYASTHVDISESNPWVALAKAFLGRPLHGPTMASVHSRRVEYLVEGARRAGAQVAVLLHYKYCDPHAFEAVELERRLREAGLAVIRLEIDREALLTPRHRTELEALLESLP